MLYVFVLQLGHSDDGYDLASKNQTDTACT